MNGSRKRFENRLPPPAEEKQNNPMDGGILDGDITATKCLRSIQQDMTTPDVLFVKNQVES